VVDGIIREEISRKGAKPQRRAKFLNFLGFLGVFAPLREISSLIYSISETQHPKVWSGNDKSFAICECWVLGWRIVC
jgi:hypothetical protein